MKYRTKIYLMIMAIACLGVFSALYIIHKRSKAQLINELRSQVESIAATGSIFLDGDLFTQIHTTADQKTPAFNELHKQLRTIQRSNQTKDLTVEYVYTLRPSQRYQGYMEVIVDASTNPRDFAPPGQLHRSQNIGDILNHLNEIYSPSEFTDAMWGRFLTGFAPIYDSSGDYVATIGVDVNSRVILADLNKLFYYGIYAVVVALALALALAHFLSQRMTKVMEKFCQAAHEIQEGNLDHQVVVETNDEFSGLAIKMNEMARGLKERDYLKTSFSRYVSKRVLEKLVHMDLETKGEYKKITVLFADIREFTKLAESLDPEEVVCLLNEYFERMLHVIFRNNGTLDKFIGDSIMVDFGTPLDDANQEENAVKSAIEMLKELKILCDEWESKGKQRIQIDIGIHTGGAIVGNIGSRRRLEYTAIGDTVNIASRLEHESKALGSTVVLSKTTYSAIKDKYRCKSLGKVSLSGRQEEIEVYALEEDQFQN